MGREGAAVAEVVASSLVWVSCAQADPETAEHPKLPRVLFLPGSEFWPLGCSPY